MKPSRNSIYVETMSEEIRNIYNSDPSNAGALIENFLEHKLIAYSHEDKLSFLEELAHKFEGFRPDSGLHIDLEQKEASQLISLILGKSISINNIGPNELMEKLSQALNAVFDSLNHIISVINTTLLGKRVELETIRHVIGSELAEEKGRDSIQDYLDQIQEAFLIAHKAFQQAAGAKIGQILNELDPDSIAAVTEKSLKPGPFRKAENFEVYSEKYRACKTWFEDGRAINEMLREFEKICQKSYKIKARG
jgi:hypothetical protein